jgi:hypothetical protein
VLQPYYHILQEGTHQARQTTLRSYFKKRSEKLPTDPKMAGDDPVDPDDPQHVFLLSITPIYLYFIMQ